MSTPRPEAQPDQEVAGKHEDDPGSASQAEPQAAEHDDVTPDGAAPAEIEGQPSATDELREVLKLLKRPPHGNHTRGLCNDGIVRYMVWLPTPDDEVTRQGVYDAQPLSPRMIKRWLDRKPWSQAVEDRFRGVDGRNVPKEQWLNPPPGVLPFPGTLNERMAAIEQNQLERKEQQKELEEKIARGEIDKSALEKHCTSWDVISDYDLDPR